MAEREGYDQPGDGYTGKKATIGVDAPSPYQPGIIPPQQHGFIQQPYAMQHPYAQNTNTAVIVNQPQAGTVIIQQRPPDYMVPSVLACLFCCWPTGLCAIFFACEAYSLANAGDFEGAKKMSDNARSLMITSVFTGLIFITVAVVLQFTVVQY